LASVLEERGDDKLANKRRDALAGTLTGIANRLR
jgi:hypothetical protein